MIHVDFFDKNDFVCYNFGRIILKLLMLTSQLSHHEGVHKMPNDFFENCSVKQDKLVALMTPVIQTYHKAANPSTKEAKTAITESITLLEKFISTIRKNVDTTQTISPQYDKLNEQTETLVTSMIQIIQNSYPSKATPTADQTRTVITQPQHIKSLRELMGSVLGSIIEQQNQAMAAALQAADDDPYCGY